MTNHRRIPVSDEAGPPPGPAAPTPEAPERDAPDWAAETVPDAPESRDSGGRKAAAAPAPSAAATEEALREQLARLAADFDNFRKRESRERAEAWTRAKTDLVEKLLPALDDLRRVAHPEAAEAPPGSPVHALLEGVALVERKLLEALSREGLQEIEALDATFDPTVHEAILTQPTDDPRLAGRVAHVVEPGYRFGNRLMRPAKVVVWTLPR
jgi:molecular chaperone GrpE